MQKPASYVPALICTAGISVAFGATPNDPGPIDRHALVTRHNLEWNGLGGEVPLGNGGFCFNVVWTDPAERRSFFGKETPTTWSAPAS